MTASSGTGRCVSGCSGCGAVHGTRRWEGSRSCATRTPLSVHRFVDAHHLPPIELAVCDGPISRVLTDLNRIEISQDLSRFDVGFAYAHELGHLFDVDYLRPDHRLRFSNAVGTGAEWSGGEYNRNVEEAWANAFAVVTCSGPWWGDGWVCCN